MNQECDIQITEADDYQTMVDKMLLLTNEEFESAYGAIENAWNAINEAAGYRQGRKCHGH